MKETKKYGLPSLKRDFPTEEACLDFIFDTLHSRKCSCGGVYARLKDRKQYQCSKCRFQIAPMVGTIFEKSPTPLSLWFQAVLAFSSSKSGISSKQMQRQLEVTYKCAWRILNQIRKALKQGGQLDRVVEVDATHIGGINKKSATRYDNKTPVMVAIQRSGEMRAEVAKNLTMEEHKNFMEKYIKSGSIVLTDGARIYKNSTKGYTRLSVEYRKGEYVRGSVHINKVETFFSHLKRSLRGTHKSISRQHLQSYLDAFVFHYNNRHSDKARFEALLGNLLRLAK